MRITLFEGSRTNPLFSTVVEMEAGEFLDAVASESEVPYVACANDNDKKRGTGFVLAQYKKNATSKSLKSLETSSSTDVFCFDIDYMSVKEIADALPLWQKHSCTLYSTYGHEGESNPRYRLLLQLSEAVPNYHKEPFHTFYMGAARALGIKADPKALDRARFFFGPQYHLDNESKKERHRFTGVPFNCTSNSSVDAVEVSQEETFNVAHDRPTRQELSRVPKKLRKSKAGRLKSIASALEAILREEEFAPAGSIHNTSMEVAFELVREFRNLDAVWFAEQYLKPCWELMCPDRPESAMADWKVAVESAIEKHNLSEAERKAEQKAMALFTIRKPVETTADVKANANKMKGKLVMSYRGAYFVYSPKADSYKGPYKTSEVAVVVRDLLSDVPGVTEIEYNQNGEVIKGAIKLNHQYGTTADSVMFFPKKPPSPYDAEGNALNVQAYKWIDWTPRFHDIADELLHVVTGKHYELVEAYLTQFRNLDQPLPALTFVGARGSWKSRICQLLSRFWTTKHGPSPGKAKKIMTRFNEHLALNPVVWSDEQLATTYQGKPQPEEYRESITDLMQTIEFKGVSGLVLLKSAVRHVISVNNDDKIFSSEVDSDSIMATMERFLLLYIDESNVRKFEEKWFETPEMDALREGTPLLEHIRWLEENRVHESTGRLFVQPHAEAQILLRARFNDDVLLYIWQVAFESLRKELTFSHKGQIQRLPLYCKDDGNLYLSPSRIQDLWGTSKATEGSMIRKPTNQRIGTLLAKAGFKSNKGARATKSRLGGWKVDLNTLKQFIEVSDFISWEEVQDLCLKVFDVKLNDSE